MADRPPRDLFFPGPDAAAQRLPSSVVRPRPTPSRRLAMRWIGWGALSMLVAGWTNGFLRFFQPGRTASSGTMVTAATVDELKVGDVKSVAAGRFYLTRVPEGFIALWWKCPHLGCTVPWKQDEGWSDLEDKRPGDAHFATQGRFHCPCHGSLYDRYGQIVKGPAQRPMDRFPVVIENGLVRVETGPRHAIVRRRAGPEGATPA